MFLGLYLRPRVCTSRGDPIVEPLPRVPAPSPLAADPRLVAGSFPRVFLPSRQTVCFSTAQREFAARKVGPAPQRARLRHNPHRAADPPKGARPLKFLPRSH